VSTLLLSVRKLAQQRRWKRLELSDIPIFRMVHGLVGALTLFVLAVHTGLELGENMIKVLSIDFLLAALFGAVAGGVTVIAGDKDVKWTPIQRRDRPKFWSYVHLALCIPLPVLVIMHVIQVYFY